MCAVFFCLILVSFLCVVKSVEMYNSPGLALLREGSSSDNDSDEEMNFSLGMQDASCSQHDSTMFSIEFEPSGR